MQSIMILISIFNMYQVKWFNDYHEISLYEDTSNYYDLPEAKLYDSNGIDLMSEISYHKGVNRTSLSVVNSKHVKTFKIDYRVYFLDYGVSYDHTITFNIIDDIAPEFIKVEDIVMPVKSKVLTLKEILASITYSDNYYSNSDLVLNVRNLNLVNVNVVGRYLLIYELTDPSGNKTSIEVYYEVVSNNYPEIKFTNPIKHEYGKVFNYLDYIKISDEYDYNLDIDINISNVNFNILGTYDIVITARNSSNLVTKKTANINIVDTIKPELIISSNLVFNIFNNSEVDLKGLIIHVKDNYSDLSNKDVMIISNVDFNKIGNYEVTFEISDESNNTTSKKVIIQIRDLSKPEAILIQDLQVEVFSKNINYYYYFLFKDNVDIYEDLTIKFIDKLINYSTLGYYQLEVEVTDSNKNKLTSYFILEIVDTTSPIVNKVNEIIINDFLTPTNDYLKNYFSIVDNYDSYTDIKLEVNGFIDYQLIGNYPITMLFIDLSNNITLFETVIYVLDNIDPIIILKEETITISINSKELNYEDLILEYYDNYTLIYNLKLTISNNIDYSNVGKYYIKYELTDESYNKDTKVIDVYVDLDYEVLITGTNLRIKKNEEFTLGEGLTLSHNVVRLDYYPKRIDVSKKGVKEVFFVAYDSRGNYQEFVQTIEIIEDDNIYTYLKYLPIIIVNIGVIVISIYLSKRKSKNNYFD